MKKIFSVLLVICIISTLLSVLASAEPDGYTFTYDFDEGLTANAVISGITYDQTCESWSYDSQSAGISTLNVNANGYGIEAVTTAAGNWFALKIKISVAGTYSGTYIHGQTKTNGGNGSVFLLPGNTSNIATAISSAEPLCSVSYYGATNVKTVTETLSNVSIPTAGEYLLVFHVDSKEGGFRMYAGSLTLTNGSAAAPLGAIVTSTEDTVVAGESVQLSVSGYMSDRTAIDMSTATVQYSSNNNYIATVNAETGLVTGVFNGNAVITASVEVNGVTVRGTKQITVTGAPLSDYSFVYDFVTDIEHMLRLESIDYAMTSGFWTFDSITPGETISTLRRMGYGLQMGTNTTQYVALRINVPEAGVYSANLRYGQAANGCVGGVYLMPASTTDIGEKIKASNKIGEVDYYASAAMLDGASYIMGLSKSIGNVSILEAGEYILVFQYLRASENGGSSSHMYPAGIELIGGSEVAPMSYISTSKTDFVGGETATAVLNVCRNDTKEPLTVTKSFRSSDESVVSVHSESGALTANAQGTAKISASFSYGGKTYVNTANVTVSDAAATATADVLVTAANLSRGGLGVNANIVASGTDSLVKGTKSAQNVGTEITVTADAEADGAAFKFWQNHTTGKVLSSERSFKFTVGSNIMLVAVYSKAPDANKYAVDFLNANGAVIQSTYVEKDTLISEIVPAVPPTMTGYTFTGWNAPLTQKITGNTYVLAEYADAGITASISVNGGTATAYNFNDEVEVNSADTSFSYWTRNGKIISYDKDYTFYAWTGDTDVAAVCNGAVAKTPRVLLDGTAIGDAFMMEYEIPTGFTKVEAGIIYGGNDVTLASYTAKAILGSDAAHGQFTAMANTENFARAYLIYNDGENNKIVYSDIVGK